MPKRRGRALALWDCSELARQLVTERVVTAISPETVRRVLTLNQLKPWREHSWLSTKVPRDADFAARVRTICDLYTRLLADDEVVLCIDEKTSIQPRGRTAPTLPAQAGKPACVEQTYMRSGALNLFAAFNTRSGEVIGWSAAHKRAPEFVSWTNSFVS